MSDPNERPAAETASGTVRCLACKDQYTVGQRAGGMIHFGEYKCIECGNYYCHEHARAHFTGSKMDRLGCQTFEIATEALGLAQQELATCRARIAALEGERNEARALLQKSVMQENEELAAALARVKEVEAESAAHLLWAQLGTLTVAIANGKALRASATELDDNPVNCISVIMDERDALRTKLATVEGENTLRIYFQDIVYSVCNTLDQINRKRPGVGIVCGRPAEPSREVQDAMLALKTAVEQAGLREKGLREALEYYAGAPWVAEPGVWHNKDYAAVATKALATT